MNRLLRFGYAAERSEVNLLSRIQVFSAHISAVLRANVFRLPVGIMDGANNLC